MAVERIRLAEGVYLNCIPCDSFKSNYMAMFYITPLEKESAARRALVPRVLRRGCRNYPDMTSLTERMQTLYNVSLSSGLVYKRGEMQIVGQSVDMLDNSVIPDGTDVMDGALSLFGDVWYSPLVENGAFSEKYTEGEKNSLSDAIRAAVNNKSSYASMRCWQEMCRGERFGVDVSGTLSEVEAAAADSVYAEYQNLLRRMPCEIYYVGRGDAAMLAQRLSGMFAHIERKEIITSHTDVIRRAGSLLEVTEEQPAAQSRLSIGFRTGTCEAEGTRPVMLMLNEVYGGSPLSKLFMNVREKRSLCYYCYSAAEQIKGVMMVSCGIDATQKETAQSEILAQLEDIRDGKITDAEMDAARRSLRCALTQIEDEPESMVVWNLGRRLSGRTVTLAEELEQIDAVTRADISAAAQRITADTVYFMRGTGTPGAEEEADEEE